MKWANSPVNRAILRDAFFPSPGPGERPDPAAPHFGLPRIEVLAGKAEFTANLGSGVAPTLKQLAGLMFELLAEVLACRHRTSP